MSVLKGENQYLFAYFVHMYEHKSQPLASMYTFINRVLKNILIGGTVLGIFILIGVVGYHYSSDLSWTDSFYNACMILTGMGPAVPVFTTSGKIFASFYALFSVLVFIANISLVITPVAHRFFHKLHIEKKEG
jgi:hypothetical protein